MNDEAFAVAVPELGVEWSARPELPMDPAPARWLLLMAAIAFALVITNVALTSRV